MKIVGIDIGITSIGWAFVENGELKDCGVRIFTGAENPKNGESLALPRRQARSVRRRLARRRGRLESLKKLLTNAWHLSYEDYIATDGELPKAFYGKRFLNPYQLRYEALERLLSKEELMRVILHIAKHRGYGNKNIKQDQDKKDKEEGKILSALSENAKKISHYRTAGEYFYKEFCAVQDVGNAQDKTPMIRVLKPIRNKALSYENCVSQVALQNELSLIFEIQRGFGFAMTQELCDEVLHIAFYQRPLKDFSHLVGKCTFYENEYRAPKYSLSAVEFVTISKVINILASCSKESGEIYTQEQYQKILSSVFEEVCNKGSLSFAQLRKMLNIDESIQFQELKHSNLEKPETKKFVEFKNFKKFCHILGDVKQDRETSNNIARDLTLTKDKEQLKQKLCKYPALTQDQIMQLSEIDFDHHISLSLKALGEILPFMRNGIRYDQACKNANLVTRHNDKKMKFLPPFNESMYAQDLHNPVVLRAISEYRKVLNALIKKYGRFHKIHIELAREVGKSYKDRGRYQKEIDTNYKNREQAKEMCKKIDLPLNENNILKLRLFREQDEVCAYSGKKITLDDLKNAGALEIDHILPYSRSFDNGYLNKVLVFTKENQNKGNKTPFEAFGADCIKWSKIVSLAIRNGYPKKKAQNITTTTFATRESGFKARNLSDTRYIARLIASYTREYLACLPLDCNEDTMLVAGEKGSKIHVETINGMLTTTMRHFWGLPVKNRFEHTHHAIDAIIIAYSNASMIKRFSDFVKNHQETLKAELYAKELAQDTFKHQRKFFEPFAGFREHVLHKIAQIFVSHSPNRRVRGALHEETFKSFNDATYQKAYGGLAGIQKALELGKIRQIGTKLVANGEMVRVDIFAHKKSKKFYAVPIYTMDIALGVLPNKAVVGGKSNGVIKDWIEMDENYEFCFSLFKGDVVLVQKSSMEKPEFAYFVYFGVSTASIALQTHDNNIKTLTPNQQKLFTSPTQEKVTAESLGIQRLKVFEKYKVSPLGELKPSKYEPRQPIALKTTPKTQKPNKDS